MCNSAGQAVDIAHGPDVPMDVVDEVTHRQGEVAAERAVEHVALRADDTTDSSGAWDAAALTRTISSAATTLESTSLVGNASYSPDRARPIRRVT